MVAMLKPLTIPAACENRLRLGTCSWKYDSWKGLVYDVDKDYQAGDYLADYARYYGSVEVDQWFWSLFPGGVRLPNPETVLQYAASVPEDFRFTVKVPNAVTLTHYYAKQPKGSASYANKPNPHFLDVEIFGEFLESLDPMKNKLGPIMFQFEYLNKTKMPSLNIFLERLGDFFGQAPKGYAYAIEIRNPNYLKEEFFAFLKQRQIGMVLLEGYYMPPIKTVVEANDVYASNFLVIRLHGPDRKEIETKTKGVWDGIVLPKDEGLASAATIIQASLDKDLDTYVNVNNHYEGCAPLSIERLVSLV
jgi:uncharacterized protein YecE (DUF72 family)